MRRPLRSAIAIVVFCTLSFSVLAQSSYHHTGGNANNSSNPPGPNSTGRSGTGANIDVIYHKIYWRISPDTSVKYIKGYVQTNFKTIQASVTTLTFDLNAVLTLDSVKFRGAKLAGVTRSGNIVTIPLAATLANNFIDSLTIYYQGTPPAINIPPGAVGYQKSNDAGAGNYIYTLSESYEDRDWWPCKADMQDKIDSMDIIVSVPWASPTAADTFWVSSNGKLVDSSIVGSSRIFTFKTRYPTASYLVAVNVARCKKYYRSVNINGTVLPVAYNLFIGKSAGTTNAILLSMDSMNLALPAFGAKLGDYPFKNEKHGFYEFGFSGGMEHQTFSGIGTGSLSNVPILAHEMTHQWFGDNVTFATWNDLWLAEGFAVYGETTWFYELVANHPLTAVGARNNKKNAALSETVSAWIPDGSCGTSNLWNSAYGSSVYDRGCMVVSMLRAMVGDTKFYQALSTYQSSYHGMGVTTDSLKNRFNALLGIDITPFFNDFVGGSGPGASGVGGLGNPINTVKWNSPAANKLVVQMGAQTWSATNNGRYYRGPVVMHFTNAPSGWSKDTSITIFDWGPGAGGLNTLSYAGNGISDSIPGNILNFDLSFTPTNAFYDDSAKTLTTGSMSPTPALMGYIWNGATSSSWNTATNWVNNTIPPAGAQVRVATTGSQPLLPGSITLGGLFINPGSTLNIGTNVLVIDGPVSGTGTITGSASSSLTINDKAGTLNFDQSSAATRSLNDLTISTGSTATLGTALDLYGTLAVNNGALDLNGKNLTLKSNAAGTARIADLSGSTLSGATNVTMERYIPSKRAWRLLSAPTTGQSIKQSWQENQLAMANGNPGYGTLITSTTGTAQGYDASSSGNSLITYNSGTNAWGYPGATSSAIASTSGYLLYIRGDRSVIPSNNVPTATTLRTTGTIYQGTQSPISVASGQYGLVGNIFPSAIDFNVISGADKTVDDKFWVWDPKLSTAGAYQTFTPNGLGSYNVTPAGVGSSYPSPPYKNIESGQAFFVFRTVAGSGSITLKEAHKAAGSRDVQGPSGGPGEQIQTSLYGLPSTTNYLADGVLNVYDNNFSNAVDQYDAGKLTNFSENLGTLRSGQLLSVENRQLITVTDTIFFNIASLKQQEYRFEFNAANLNHPGLTAVLEDNYQGTTSPINLNDITNINFTVDANAGSSASNRFRIIFQPSGPLPLTFTDIRATQAGGNIAVDWKVSNALNIEKYEVEKALDGVSFSRVGVQFATGTNGSDASYTWLDINPADGDNFYRVRSIGLGGEIKYSGIVKLTLKNSGHAITVYPNPVKGSGFELQVSNLPKGTYALSLINKLGQIVYAENLLHNGGSITQYIDLKHEIPAGVYEFVIEGVGVKLKSRIVKE